MLDEGYLYLIKNKAWPGWIKVGITKNINYRIRTYQTGSPYRDYEVVYSIKHPEYRSAEKKIKEQMKHFASEIRNEWFKISFELAKDRLIEQLDNYFYEDCDYNQKYNTHTHSKEVMYT